MRFVFCLFIFLCSCQREVKQSPQVSVVTYIVDTKNLPITFDLVGVCQSSHLVEIRSRVAGYLDQVAYTEGQYVQEGQLLFKIDPRELKAQVAEVKANLEREEAILWSAERAVERYKPLYEQKAASRKDLEDATAQLLAQQATVNNVKARLDEVLLNLSYTEITSPIAGYTTSTKYQEGTFINPAVNELLTTVSVIDPIWVMVNVSDFYFLESSREVAEGRMLMPKNYNFNVRLILADGSEYPEPGVVNFVSPVLNPTTGTLNARAVFQNPNFLLKPGQFVRARVTGAQWINAMLVPQSAVLQGENGRFVYVVSGGGRVERRDVVTGSWYEEGWIIKSGLQKGDEVIQEGVNKVQEGMVVKVVHRSKKSRNM